jgi:hypothetical protein
VAASTSLTPEQRKARAKKASEAAHSTDTLIRRIVDKAPELTEAQKARLAAIFAPSEGA